MFQDFLQNLHLGTPMCLHVTTSQLESFAKKIFIFLHCRSSLKSNQHSSFWSTLMGNRGTGDGFIKKYCQIWIPLYFSQRFDSLICQVIKAQVQIPEAAVVRPQSWGQSGTSISCHFTEWQPTEIKQLIIKTCCTFSNQQQFPLVNLTQAPLVIYQALPFWSRSKALLPSKDSIIISFEK